MRKLEALLTVFFVLVAGSGMAIAVEPEAAQSAAEDAELTLQSSLALDPVAVLIVRVDHPGESWGEFLGFLRKLMPEEELENLENDAAKLDQELGLSLREDLLAQIGPELAVSLDVPPIDMVAGLVMAKSPDAFTVALGKIGLLCQVRDRERLNRSLQKLVAKAEAESSQEGTLMRVDFSLDEVEEVPELSVFYGFKGDRFAIGFSPEWVTKALAGPKAGARLTDGLDFARVTAQLDTEPTALYYLNLPKLRDMLVASQMVKGALAGEPEAARVAEVFFDPAMTETGIGGSYRMTDGGLRRVVFGPKWLGGGTQVSLVAAIAIPNLLNAIQRGRQKRTLADMRTVATAIEAYGIDNEAYPSSDADWVEVSAIADSLSPAYLRQVPATDGWGNPMMFWGDGSSYVLVSAGRDGEQEREWTADAESRSTSEFSQDLVYANGQFVSMPADASN